MSKKNKDVLYKSNVIVNFFELKEQISWSANVANRILRDEDVKKSWKGTISIFPSITVIKSRNKSYKKKYENEKICGLFMPEYNGKVMVLGIFEKEMLYFILRFDTSKERDLVHEKITSIKGPDLTEINSTLNTLDDNLLHSQTNGSTFIHSDMSSTNDPFIRRNVPKIPEEMKYDNTDNKNPLNLESGQNKLSLPKDQSSIILEQRQFNNRNENTLLPRNENMLKAEESHEMLFSETASNDSDVMPGTWVEDVKYITYEASIGRNVECDNGSVYMYTAHQIVPNGNYEDSFDSDSN